MTERDDETARPRRRGGRRGQLERLAKPVSPAVYHPGPHAETSPAGDSRPPSPSAPDGNKAGRTLVIACGAVVRELLAAIRASGFEHMDVAAIPAKLHNRPEKIPGAVRCRIRSARARQGYARILVLYGDCGTGGELDRVLAEEGVERIDGAHCYAFYVGPDRFEALHDAEPATFYLTDYLVRHFDALIIRGLGLDRHPHLIREYFGNYRTLTFLSQIPDPELTTRAIAAAKRLGLTFNHIDTGLGDISDFVGRDSASLLRHR